MDHCPPSDPFPSRIRRGSCEGAEGRVSRMDDIRNLADEEVMQLVQQGDPRAFELLYDRHGGAAFSVAYRMVGDRAAAEDISQEAFLSIWRSRQRYAAERGSVRTWVLGVVHHRAIDSLRRNVVHQRRRASAEGIEERFEASERTDLEAARREDARHVRGALDSLPDEQCRVIELAYFGGFSHSEIAEMLETPVGTVKGRMRLGLDKLRHQLSEAVA
jgi:RNA polymerase sigma-70 factor (ECF subfamily)